MSHFLECACLIIRGDQLPKRRRLLTRISQVVADVAVAVEGAWLQLNSIHYVCRDHQSCRSGAAMKRPAAANLKRKAEEPLEEVEPDAVQQADGENDGPDHDQADEGHSRTKKRSTRTPEEQEVLKNLPELENYRVLQLAISHVQTVWPGWCQGLRLLLQ